MLELTLGNNKFLILTQLCILHAVCPHNIYILTLLKWIHTFDFTNSNNIMHELLLVLIEYAMTFLSMLKCGYSDMGNNVPN